MPFKSEAQHRKFRAMVAEGAIPKKTLDKWVEDTKKKNPDSKHPIKDLPEKVAGKEEDVVVDFLSKNKNPTDSEFHANAKNLGLDEHKVEETAYSMLGSFIDSVRTKEAADKIKGGLADHMKASDFDKKQLNKGIKVEKEHTESPEIAKEIAEDHLTENPKYYETLEKMENKLEKKAFIDGFRKAAGGPGSGVSEDNAKVIDFLEDSPLVSIGYRKKLMKDNNPVKEGVDILVKDIKYKGQEKYVPKKLQKFLDAIEKGETWPFEKPIDVLRDEDGKYHILDGHHRGLAAIKTKKDKIKANVYSINSETRKVASLTEIFTKGSEGIKGNEKLTYIFGLNKPTTGQEGPTRVDLVDQAKRDRPESFQ